MSFSGGGANTSGVRSQEKGNLIVHSDNITITGDGAVNTDYTVPANKKWIGKMVKSTKVSGTFTIQYKIRIFDGTDYVTIFDSATSNLKEFGDQNIVLPAGWSIRFTDEISGHSVNGDINHQVLYQEFDV